MRLPWNRAPVCSCAPPAPLEPEVSALSPARLLAASLTDPETRGEWEKNPMRSGSVVWSYGSSDTYRNEARSISVSRHWGYGSSSIYTPFTLSEAEERIVRDAMERFDRRQREEREKEVLARLIAPASGIVAATAGETEGLDERSEQSPAPEGGDAQGAQGEQP